MSDARSDWASLLHISKGQLATYLLCPKRFWFQYVRGEPWEFTPANLAFGKAIHEAVAGFYRYFAQHREKPIPEEIQRVFRHSWWQQLEEDGIRFFGDQNEKSLTEQGEKLLKVFHAEVRPRRVKAVESPFTVRIANPNGEQSLEAKLVGIIDLLEEDDEGSVILSELKTSSKKYSDLQGEYQLDGLVYSYAARQLGLSSSGDGQVLVRYDVLVKTKTPAFQQVYFTKEETDFNRFVRWVQEILQAIEAQVFYPIYGWQCQQCPFRKACWEGRNG